MKVRAKLTEIWETRQAHMHISMDTSIDIRMSTDVSMDMSSIGKMKSIREKVRNNSRYTKMNMKGVLNIHACKTINKIWETRQANMHISMNEFMDMCTSADVSMDTSSTGK